LSGSCTYFNPTSGHCTAIDHILIESYIIDVIEKCCVSEDHEMYVSDQQLYVVLMLIIIIFNVSCIITMNI